MADKPLTLAQKVRKAREFKVVVEPFTFIVRRPTEVEWFDHIVGAGTTARFLPFVVGWEGVKELDIIAGGDPHPLPFDADVCAEWLSDRSDIYGKIIGAINEAFQAHSEARETVAKN